MHTPDRPSPFQLERYLSVNRASRLRPVLSLAERVLALSGLDQTYRSTTQGTDPANFIDEVLDDLNVRVEVDAPDGRLIPREGPVIVMSNHPFGGIDGIILPRILLNQRHDVRVMANFLTAAIPELEPLVLAVDPFGGERAVERNLAPTRRTIRWLRDGHALAVFPSGEVSHFNLRSRTVVDPPWQAGISRIARMTGATVVPAYFEGSNSTLFQIMGLIHARLRTAMLPREFLKRRNDTVSLRLGASIDPRELDDFPDDASATAWIRACTYALKERSPSRRQAPRPQRLFKREQPIAEPVPSALLAEEMETLGNDGCLGASGELSVHCAAAEQMPMILREIGRLREIAFRAAGEGTGMQRDIDLFDNYYQHLFVWDRTNHKIAGAYRLGLADHIVSRYGLRGLYTQTLFRYNKRLMERLNPAIELGRSFVHPDYQRSFAPLMLLWKGIGQFVAKNPRYRYLFGPVSISAAYNTISQQLLVRFLKLNAYEEELAKLVRPRTPFKDARHFDIDPPDHCLADADRMANLLQRIEVDGKGIPVLLRQYLKLGGRIVAFNVDPDFNNSLDGLIAVDLLNADPRTLSRYLGKAGAAEFIAFHQQAWLQNS